MAMNPASAAARLQSSAVACLTLILAVVGPVGGADTCLTRIVMMGLSRAADDIDPDRADLTDFTQPSRATSARSLPKLVDAVPCLAARQPGLEGMADLYRQRQYQQSSSQRCHERSRRRAAPNRLAARSRQSQNNLLLEGCT